MRWIIKTSFDGTVYDDLMCDGEPPIPDNGANLLVPLSGSYTPGVVVETSVDRSQCPAVLWIVCCNPAAYARN